MQLHNYKKVDLHVMIIKINLQSLRPRCVLYCRDGTGSSGHLGHFRPLVSNRVTGQWLDPVFYHSIHNLHIHIYFCSCDIQGELDAMELNILNPLKWCSKERHNFPYLFKAAKNLFVTQGLSSESERYFSTASRIMTKES